MTHYTDDTITLHHGDCLDVLRDLPDASVDAVVTDPPYGLEFMGKEWDGADGFRRSLNTADVGRDNAFGRTSRTSPEYRAGTLFQQWCELWTTECLRVLKPGGHLLAFGGTRTWHRLACAVEDAGFEVRDSIAWMYGSGFPKSLDVSKAIDKAAGAEREVVGERTSAYGTDTASGERVSRAGGGAGLWVGSAARAVPLRSQEGATDHARTWQGWGTALKPAFEPVVVARKPLAGTVAANVLAWGTGALNVDGCRVGDETLAAQTRGLSKIGTFEGADGNVTPERAGRWPANVVLDEGQAEALDAQSGELSAAGNKPNQCRETGTGIRDDSTQVPTYNGGPTRVVGDSGGASRFFYVAKADASERVRVAGVAHPTVKPLALMRWLVRLVTPPGGVVLEPFAGSGTTVEACILEGFRCIAIEREADYLPLIEQRIHRRRDPVAAVRGSGEDGGLFDLLDEEPTA